MRNLTFGATTLIAAMVGFSGLVLAPAAKAENAVIDQCVNQQTGRLVGSSFCSCRVYWNTAHREFRIRGGATALCADHGNRTLGSLNRIGTPGVGGGGNGGGGGQGGGSGAGPGGGGGTGPDGSGGLGGDDGDDNGGNVGLGNPGNDKDVGNAGEDPSGKGMGPTGSRGKNH